MSDLTRRTPVEIETRRRTRRRGLILLVLVLAGAAYFYWRFNPDSPVTYNDIGEHFKYGSIGSEPATGLPYWIFRALPEMFADKLPGAREGYESLGFVTEGRDLPIGFSKRRVLIDRVWLNCSVCHVGTVRETRSSEPVQYLGMPANTMDLQAFIRFLYEAALDERFTADRMLAEIDAIGNIGFLERLLYRYVVIPQTRARLVEVGNITSFFARQPGDWGPGRVDTFNPYKVVQFNFPPDRLTDEEIVGVSDLPSIWQQRKREGMDLHWDGNNASVEERNKSAALGAGVTPATIDIDGIERIEEWLWDLEPPAYPFGIDHSLAEEGQAFWAGYCQNCHGVDGRDFTGDRVGTVVPIDEIGTDRSRLDSFTPELAANQNTLFAGYPWRFSQFKKTNGYSNLPLDGIWLRAPYLHNGSVPTLRDLLEPPENRPEQFYRGYDVFDPVRVGFISDVEAEGGTSFFLYDTRLRGNGNQGHLYGTNLAPQEKDALVEYMKQF
jgi:hypothetical protein